MEHKLFVRCYLVWPQAEGSFLSDLETSCELLPRKINIFLSQVCISIPFPNLAGLIATSHVIAVEPTSPPSALASRVCTLLNLPSKYIVICNYDRYCSYKESSIFLPLYPFLDNQNCITDFLDTLRISGYVYMLDNGCLDCFFYNSTSSYVCDASNKGIMLPCVILKCGQRTTYQMHLIFCRWLSFSHPDSSCFCCDNNLKLCC